MPPLDDESSRDIRIFDDVSGRFVEILQVVLIDLCGKTHIPEIFEVFGQEYTLKFLDIFRGSTIKIPSSKSLHDAVRDTSIYVQVEQTAEGSKAQVIRDLAVKHNITPQKVRSIYYGTQERLARFKVPRQDRRLVRDDVRGTHA